MAETSLGQYADTLFGGEDDMLAAMRRDAQTEDLPSIQVPTELGRLLQLLIRASGVRSVLEIGTLFGYSATIIARALPPDGRLTTLEANPKHAEAARRNLDRAGVSAKVSLLEGPALNSLPGLQGQTFDLVFIDADKPSYPAYLEWALQVTEPGSLIIADNVWRSGSVIEDTQDDAATGMAEFNRALAGNPRLLSTFVSTRDGEDAASVSVVQET
ncbi:MAG: O-methyltransferase [Chloroflexota bacterium]